MKPWIPNIQRFDSFATLIADLPHPEISVSNSIHLSPEIASWWLASSSTSHNAGHMHCKVCALHLVLFSILGSRLYCSCGIVLEGRLSILTSDDMERVGE